MSDQREGDIVLHQREHEALIRQMSVELIDFNNLPVFDPNVPVNLHGDFDPENLGQVWSPNSFSVEITGTPSAGSYIFTASGDPTIQWDDDIETIREQYVTAFEQDDLVITGTPLSYIVTLSRGKEPPDETMASFVGFFDDSLLVDATGVAEVISEAIEGANAAWTITVTGTMTAGSYTFGYGIEVPFDASTGDINNMINEYMKTNTSWVSDRYEVSGTPESYTITHDGMWPRKVDGSDSLRSMMDFTNIDDSELVGATVVGELTRDGVAKGLWLPIGSTYNWLQLDPETWSIQYIYRDGCRDSDGLSFGTPLSRRVRGNNIEIIGMFQQDGDLLSAIDYSGNVKPLYDTENPSDPPAWEFTGHIQLFAHDEGVDAEPIHVDFNQIVNALNYDGAFGAVPMYLRKANSAGATQIILGQYNIGTETPTEGYMIINRDGNVQELSTTKTDMITALEFDSNVELYVTWEVYEND